MEAEFHSVMRRGRHLKVVTPRVDCEEYVLFSPESERTAVRLGGNEWQSWTNHIQVNALTQTQQFTFSIATVADV
jgi:hypothetical protein